MYDGSNTSIYFIHVRQHGISRILETKNRKVYLDEVKFKTKELRTWEDLYSSPQFHRCLRCVVSQSVMYAPV